MKKIVSVLTAAAMVMSGCATSVTYTPAQSNQVNGVVVKYDAGVPTLHSQRTGSDVLMLPAFKTYPSGNSPTFILAYRNTSAVDVDFDIMNVKAFYNNSPVAIWTYAERIAHIKERQQAEQVAIILLTALAGAAAAHASSKQTYTTRSSYAGRTYASSTVVNTPLAGIAAGAAVGTVGVLGLAQSQYSADADVRAADQILQRTTVAPGAVSGGTVVLKDCCDVNAATEKSKPDKIHFEVTVTDQTHTFVFDRHKL